MSKSKLFSTLLIPALVTGVSLAVNPIISQAGCGCSFQSASSKNSDEYLFHSKIDYSSAEMNIEGKSIKLKLVSKKEPKKEVKGSKSTLTYESLSGDTKVRVDRVATQVCKTGDTECEAVGYDAIITVDKAGRQQIFKASGDCGC